MMLSQCPTCKTVAQLPDGSEGRKARCGKCGMEFVVARQPESAGESNDILGPEVFTPPSSSSSREAFVSPLSESQGKLGLAGTDSGKSGAITTRRRMPVGLSTTRARRAIRSRRGAFAGRSPREDAVDRAFWPIAGILIAAVLGLLVFLMRPSGSSSSGRTDSSSSNSPTGNGGTLSEIFKSMPDEGGREAYNSLLRLASKVEVGTNYTDYTRDVGDVAGDVNVYLTTADARKNPEFAKRIGRAMDYFKDAMNAWAEAIKFAGYVDGGNPFAATTMERANQRRQGAWEKAIVEVKAAGEFFK